MTTTAPAVTASDLSCRFDDIQAVDSVSFAIEPGEFVAIEGPSGSGKSTLLHLMAGLESPTSGTVEIDGNDLAAMNDKDRTIFHRHHIGVVFQLYDLLPNLNTWQNVAIPALLDGARLRTLEGRARELLESVGLSERATHTPDQLSGGEQQRIAIARALMNNPTLLLADEPTGALDSVTGDEILQLLQDLTLRGHTVAIVTHEPRAAAFAARSIRMLDGHLVEPETV